MKGINYIGGDFRSVAWGGGGGGGGGRVVIFFPQNSTKCGV